MKNISRHLNFVQFEWMKLIFYKRLNPLELIFVTENRRIFRVITGNFRVIMRKFCELTRNFRVIMGNFRIITRNFRD